MSPAVNTLFDNLWQQYVKLNPAAQKIHTLLETRGDKVSNDHVAFRTFNLAPVNIETLTPHFTALGYKFSGKYTFEQKKLSAEHFEHEDPSLPKIFISELEVEKFSPFLQKTVQELVTQVNPESIKKTSFLYSGSPWSLTHETYQKLYQESEYAAWLSAFGFCANHFTVFVNNLNSFKTLEELNQFLKENSFTLNSNGGEIKGSQEVFLEQSSTMAHNLKWQFADGKFSVPSCYYEFAKRYPLKDGHLYQGFVAQSADKIFESTNQSL